MKEFCKPDDKQYPHKTQTYHLCSRDPNTGNKLGMLVSQSIGPHLLQISVCARLVFIMHR